MQRTEPPSLGHTSGDVASFFRTVFRGLLLTLLSVSFTACAASSDDPEATAQIVNDTSRTVQIWKCAYEDCRSGFPDKGTLRPGEAIPAGVSIVGVPNPWLVLTADGTRRIGCLPLVFPAPRRGVVARVSQRVQCRDSYDQDVPWPRETSSAG